MKISSNIWRMLTVIYLAVVAYLCFWRFSPSPSVPNFIFGIPTDKVLHCLMFTPAVPLVFLSLPGKWKRGFWMELPILLLTAVFSATVAGLVELFQGLTSYRSCDLYDYYADIAGISFASIVTLSVLAFRAFRSRSSRNG